MRRERGVARRPRALRGAPRAARRLGLGDLGRRRTATGPRRRSRGRAPTSRSTSSKVAYVQWTLYEQWDARAPADARPRGRADGRRPVRRRRRERGRLVARVAVSASPVARGAARRLLGRRPGLGAAAVRLAGDGGRRPRVGPHARAPRAPACTIAFAWTTWSATSASGFAARTGATAGASIPEGREAQQARGPRVLGAVLDELSRAASGVEPPRAIAEDLGVIPPFVRDSLRELGMPGYRVLPWEKDGERLSRSARLSERQRRVVEHARHRAHRRVVARAPRARSRSTSPSAPAIDGRSGGRSPRDRSRCSATCTARGPTSPSSSRRSSSASQGPHQHAGTVVGRRTGAGAFRVRSRTCRRDPDVVGALRRAPCVSRASRGDDGGRCVGTPSPLGSTWDGRGVNFALFSQHATAVDLCLFDDAGVETRVPVPSRTLHVWHVYVPGVGPGQRYGWRVHGPYRARAGAPLQPRTSCSSTRTRARSTARSTCAGPSTPIRAIAPSTTCVFDSRDDAAAKPKSVVVDDRFDWGDDRLPQVPWRETVLYELHVRGFTRLHPAVPEPLRGTFLGLASDAAIEHLTSLGVTTVKLMPVHARADEPALVAAGTHELLGLQHARRTSRPTGASRRERGPGRRSSSSRWSSACTRAGIEVVLDVVYNHTCEGDRFGPTVDLPRNRRPRLLPARARPPAAGTSTSRAAATRSTPRTRRCSSSSTDSLRYWATEMHVDGFRFDLAPALARDDDGRFDPRSGFSRGAPPGPGPLAAQAHRRAVGPRGGGLSARRLSGLVGRV